MRKEINNKDLMISNLRLRQIINNDVSFKEIIILTDGRLCSMDKDNVIRIYDEVDFNPQIIIKNNEKITDGFYHLVSIDNFLVVATDDYIKLIKIINSNDYDIINKFSIKPDYPSSWSSIYIIDNKIYFNNSCIEKIGKEFICRKSEIGSLLYMEKCKFMDWNIKFWTEEKEHSFIHLIAEKNNEIKEYITSYFTMSLTRNQKLFIEPSYVILGEDEILFDLNENVGEYSHIINKDKKVIQKKAFNKTEKDFEYLDNSNFYQKLNKNSFIHLNKNSYLNQIEIIENESSFDFKIIKKREDIKGQFFILEGKKLFVLNENKIFVYQF